MSALPDRPFSRQRPAAISVEALREQERAEGFRAGLSRGQAIVALIGSDPNKMALGTDYVVGLVLQHFKREMEAADAR